MSSMHNLACCSLPASTTVCHGHICFNALPGAPAMQQCKVWQAPTRFLEQVPAKISEKDSHSFQQCLPSIQSVANACLLRLCTPCGKADHCHWRVDSTCSSTCLKRYPYFDEGLQFAKSSKRRLTAAAQSDTHKDLMFMWCQRQENSTQRSSS